MCGERTHREERTKSNVTLDEISHHFWSFFEYHFHFHSSPEFDRRIFRSLSRNILRPEDARCTIRGSPHKNQRFAVVCFLEKFHLLFHPSFRCSSNDYYRGQSFAGHGTRRLFCPITRSSASMLGSPVKLVEPAKVKTEILVGSTRA